MKNGKKLLIGGIGVIVLIVLIAWQSGWFIRNKIAPGAVDEYSTVKPGTKLFTVQQKDIPVIYKAVGTVHSRDAVELAARIIARVVDVRVREGDRVKKGDILIKLDDTEYLAATAQAEEQVKAAKASLDAAGEAIKSTQANLEFKKSELNRIQKLAKAHITSRKQLELAIANYNQALAAWNQAIQAKSAASAQLAAARQSLQKIKTVLSYATIRSPMNGIISARLVDPGDLANPGKILLKVFNPKRLQLEVPIREGLVRRIFIGEKVPFAVGALDKRFIGNIKEIIPSVDPGSRTFMVKIAIGEGKKLVPGMFGTIYLSLGTKPALLIPQQAITTIGQIETVEQLLQHGRTRRVFIRTIPCCNDNMRQVTSGLKAGDKIIITGAPE